MDVPRRLKSKTSCFLAPSAFLGRPALIGSDGIHSVLEGGDGKRRNSHISKSERLNGSQATAAQV